MDQVGSVVSVVSGVNREVDIRKEAKRQLCTHNAGAIGVANEYLQQ